MKIMFTKGGFVSMLLPCIIHRGITNSCISTNHNVTMRHVSLHRACDQLRPAIWRLGTQHGNLWHNQQLRGRVCAHSLSVSIRNKLVLLRLHAADYWKCCNYRPRDALRAVKKRIVGNKNFKEVMLTLTVSVDSLCTPQICVVCNW